MLYYFSARIIEDCCNFISVAIRVSDYTCYFKYLLSEQLTVRDVAVSVNCLRVHNAYVFSDWKITWSLEMVVIWSEYPLIVVGWKNSVVTWLNLFEQWFDLFNCIKKHLSTAHTNNYESLFWLSVCCLWRLVERLIQEICIEAVFLASDQQCSVAFMW